MKTFRTVMMAASIMTAMATASWGGIFPNTTFGFIPVGTTTYEPASPSDLFSATSITIPSTELVNNVQCSYLGAPNDFGNASDSCAGVTPVPTGTAIGFSSFTLDLSGVSLPTITWLSGGDTMTFIATSLNITESNNGAENLLLYYLGTFNDSLGVFTTDTPASVSLAFTQVGGATGTTNFSGTFADPPQPQVPEPASLALMGSALIGLGFIRRRKV